METDTKYGIIEAQEPEFPVRKLLRVPHKLGDLIVGYPAFGPDTFSNNITEMQKRYFHSTQLSNISFRQATSAESISILVPNFKYCKTKILDSKWL